MTVKDLAAYVYANHQKIKDPSKGALFYHADYVNPGWKNMVYLTKIGRHKFYNRKENV
jgi:spore germination cell wall hydrolase CwlJ-like protein